MFKKIVSIAVVFCFLMSCVAVGTFSTNAATSSSSTYVYNVSKFPEYSGDPYVEVNNNQPYFTSDDLVTVSYESYGDLDDLGRCTVVSACIGQDLMPTEERGSISSVKPTGWHSVSYDIVSGGSLYNRCHLIGWQLTGENANKKNLITGTRYLNVTGMLPYEDMVAEYVTSTDNHVLYRVTPIFEGDNLVASGVLMEGYSVEDNGAGICYNVYMYNVQPGITIDYATGDSWLTDDSSTTATTTTATSGNSTSTGNVGVGIYILNKNSKTIHTNACSNTSSISTSNKVIHAGSLDELISNGYTANCSCMDDMVTCMVNTNTKRIHTTDCGYTTSSNIVAYTGLISYLTNENYVICGNCADNGATTTTEPTETTVDNTSTGNLGIGTYILNKSSKAIHRSSCTAVQYMSSSNKIIHTGSVDKLLENGYTANCTCMKDIVTCMVNTNTKKIHTTDCGYTISSNFVTYTGHVAYLTNAGYSICGNCESDTSATTEATKATDPVTEPSETVTTDYYLTGTFTDTPISMTVTDNVAVAKVALKAGAYNFNIVDNGVSYGYETYISNKTITSGITLSTSSENATLYASGGTYTFNYYTSYKKLVITYTGGGIFGGFTPSEDDADNSGSGDSDVVVTTPNGEDCGYNHSYDKGVVTKKATYFAKGKEVFTCSVCGATKTVRIAKLKLKKPTVKVNGGNDTITVNYKKVKGATGFQVKCIIDGKTATKSFNTKKAATKAINKLNAGTYKVKVRAFVKQGKKTAYSSWVTKKAVKVK